MLFIASFVCAITQKVRPNCDDQSGLKSGLAQNAAWLVD